jgi:hypothetical protein
MAKWSDYCISKLSFRENEKLIHEVVVHEDSGDTILAGEVHDRNWIVQKIANGKTFSCITRNRNGNWDKICELTYVNGNFKYNANLPEVVTKRKTFVSYYHSDDETSRKLFDNLFSDLMVSKSVAKGDIDSDNSDEYIKQLIQKQYLSDTTVLVVLVGPKTKCRKHVDWEIAGALNRKVGDSYAGLIGILLPGHPDYGKTTYTSSNLPKRLAGNVESGYASIFDWTDDRVTMQKRIESAYKSRSDQKKLVNKSIPQMVQNLCD